MLKSPTATETRSLPSPADLPAAEVVIYDGECQFCTRQVARLARWDGKGRLAFLSLHDTLVAERYPDLTHERLMDEMVLVTRDGQRLGGAAAFRYLTRRLPRLWILAPLMHIPFSLPLWQWCYRQVAKRRYRWNKARGNECTNDSCSVHFK
jgi:predicted DCC family thiol-disulfide oxidoreductase YuxK